MNSVQDATVTHYTQYTVADLTETTSRLNAMLTKPPHKSLKTILLKYSHQYVLFFYLLAYVVLYKFTLYTYSVLNMNDAVYRGGICREVPTSKLSSFCHNCNKY